MDPISSSPGLWICRREEEPPGIETPTDLLKRKEFTGIRTEIFSSFCYFFSIAHQAMDKQPPHPGVIAKGLGILRSSRPRSHNLARSICLVDLTLQVQVQLKSLPRFLNNRNQPLRCLELTLQFRQLSKGGHIVTTYGL